MSITSIDVLNPTHTKNILYVVVSNATTLISQFIFFIAITKLGSLELLGYYSLALAIFAPILMISNLNLRTLLATDVKNSYLFSSYLSLRLCMAAFGLLALGVVIALIGYSDNVAMILLVVGLNKTIESLGDLYYGLFQKIGRFGCIAISSSAKSVIGALIFIFIMKESHNLTLSIISATIVSSVVLLFYDIHIARPYTKDPNHPMFNRELLSLLGVSLLGGLGMTLAVLEASIPKYFIDHFYGVKELGIYTTISLILIPYSALMSSTTAVFTPTLARKLYSNDAPGFANLMRRQLMVILFFGSLTFVFCSLFGNDILNLLLPTDSTQNLNVLLILVAASIVSSIAGLLGAMITSLRALLSQVLIHLFITATSFASCYYYTVVADLGIAGASIAQLLFSGVSVLLFAFLLIKLMRARQEVVRQRHAVVI